MNADYPLRFQPILRRYLWGGRRLQTVLGKPLPAGDDYAECWELVDHGEDQSIVDGGPLSGVALHELVEKYGRQLLGDVDQLIECQEASCAKNFPLLLKYLDASQNLSVQVHPDDKMAAGLDPPDLGKTEAWYVIAAEPGSVIYAGLREGVDREMLSCCRR